ncbi:MAG: porin PorA family protein [Streptosporangiaceae bacterium]
MGRKDQASVRLGEFYQTTTTYQVDPVAGQVVDINRNELLSLRSGGGRTALVLFSGDLRMQPGSVAALVRAARQRAVVITAATVTVPAAAGLAGLVLLALGSVLALARRRRAAAAEPDRVLAVH